MTQLPTKPGEAGPRVTLADFLEAGRDTLSLETLVSGDGDRVIGEPMLNRAGLALTGFFRHFPEKRLQVIGLAETAYLDSLGAADRLARFAGLFDHGAWCVIFAGGCRPSDEETALASSRGVAVFATSLKTRVFTSRAAIVLARLTAPQTSIWGTMVEVRGLGVLIEGEPGLGKSETALGLVKRGSALVADDLVCIRKDVGTGLLFGSASDATAGFLEIRGLGFLNIPRIFGVDAVRGEKRLQLVVTFKALRDVVGELDRVRQDRQVRTVLGTDIPNVIIPVSAGRDLVNLVETAADQEKLVSSGYDPVKDLSTRLSRRAEAREAARREISKKDS